MAEPVTKKIDTFPAMEDPVATNDKLLFLDVSAPAATMTKLITMNQVRISAATQLDVDVVETAKIKDGAVTSSKLATGAVTAGKIAAGGISASSQFAAGVVDTNALKNASVTTAKLGNLQVTSDKLAAEVINDINKNLVYIQLFQTTESIINASNRTQFFVPAYLAGKSIRQIGMGVATSETGKSITIQLGTSGTYGSISGEATKEEAITKTLPAALTKIPINVTVTSGTPAPKGLDLWFLVY